ncbi:polysaccharide biosynthesis/export family protein [Rhizobium sp. BK251]|uniref:polysaccharide biosynthesis/export family protein n=1 Tax=Rhizobium sp. BK251 TaxID=2512125 RepID=UPI0010ED9F45|nr:polysaccharide biosynthesis/export family protein [Rhizobium sp. BK251]TCL66384.1 exopolysaccharide production protein ExoF [Rhizobium sp. BK251]
MSRSKHLFGRAAFLSIAFFLNLHTASLATSEPYRLVAKDKIALRVVEWRSGEGEFKDWNVLSGTFLVGEDGGVQIPLVGEVEAAGRTTQQVATRIADLLKERVGLTTPQSVSVEIAEYGPIYVVGAVEKPGEYPFSPGLTVMKAISLAGGFQRDRTGYNSRLDRDRIQAVGAFGTARLDRNALLLRKARLLAEKGGRDVFEIPDELVGIKGIAELHREEMNYMEFRRVELQSKIAAAQGIGLLYTHELTTLQGKIESQQRQVALAKKELAAVSSLADKGLALSSRRLALDRDESDEESKLLDLEFQITRARQMIEENKRDSEELVNSRGSEIQKELNEVITEIAKADLEGQIARSLISETDYEQQKLLSKLGEDVRELATFRIARPSRSGDAVRLEATPDSEIQPRDLIEVGVERAAVSGLD